MDPERSKKIFLMKVGVTVVVIIIVAAWSKNLKNVWLTEGRLAANPSNDQAWSGLKTDLEKALADTKDSLASIKEKAEQNKAEQDKADQDAFLGDVLTGAQKIASTTDEASSSPVVSASSSAPVIPASDKPIVKPDGRCPEYIDCMPTIGAPRPCQVPAGCEGITTIAY